MVKQTTRLRAQPVPRRHHNQESSMAPTGRKAHAFGALRSAPGRLDCPCRHAVITVVTAAGV